MTDHTDGNKGLLAAIMGIGIALGLALYLFLAFVMKYPGFESAPALIGCWLLALIVCAVLSRRAKS